MEDIVTTLHDDIPFRLPLGDRIFNPVDKLKVFFLYPHMMERKGAILPMGWIDGSTTCCIWLAEHSEQAIIYRIQ